MNALNDPAPLLSQGDDERSFRLTTISLILAQLAILVVVLAGARSFLAEHAKLEKAMQLSELQGLLYSVDEQTSQRFTHTQARLDSLAAGLAATPAPTGFSSVREALDAELANTPYMDGIGLTDGGGHTLQNVTRAGQTRLLPPPINTLRTSPQQSAWSFVLTQAQAGNSHLLLIRPLSKRPVQHAVYLWAALNVDSLNDIFAQAVGQTGDALWLSTDDGKVLAGQAPDRAASAPFLQLSRKLPGQPLSLHIARQSSLNSNEYISLRRQLIVSVGLASLLLLGIGYANVMDLRRREKLKKELLQANAALEERVGKRTDELEQSHREMLAFSYSISHDLRAPLRGINGFAHALREDLGDSISAQNRDYLDRIYRASVRMGELIDELLSLANISRQPLEVRRVDISAIARDILEDLHLTEPDRKAKFDIQAGIRVDGDDILLRNALQNLLHNAWKFTRVREIAHISVSAVVERDVLRCTISDNGLGFDMSHAKRLFQPFQQLHGTQGYGGTGIGLASVRRIIERHGGRVWVESAQDQGAHFTFDIPRRAALVRLRSNASKDQT